ARKQGEALVIDKFAVLGVPRVYALEAAMLEDKFRALSRKLHPDRFLRAAANERRFALEQTTILNDAFRTLKDPARRAEHLLELHGIHLAGEGPRHAHELPVVKVEMAPEFLEEMMDDREKLMDAKLEGGPDAVARLASAMKVKRDDTLARVGQLLGAIETCTDDSTRKTSAMQAAEQVARLRYYARYLDEVEGRGAEV
ncbi:MAG: Fe-S protein assembly co-chaperone HscB, partial [Deltaproteobacteria bacterium]|nr:Fe-S protein assembly co-chaperone HscB [Deltaproteobacteria bacterium]